MKKWGWRPIVILMMALMIVGVFCRIYYWNTRKGATSRPYDTGIKGGIVQEKNVSHTFEDRLEDWKEELPSFYQEYIAFHNQQAATSPASNQHHNKYLIWRCGGAATNSHELASCGGTGDRIKGIMSAFHTAICSDRIFWIDWPVAAGGKDVSAYLEPSRIDWRIPKDFFAQHPDSIPEVGRFTKMHDYSSTVLRTFAIPSARQNESIVAMRTNRWYQDELPDVHWYGGKPRDPSEWYPNQSSPCLQERLWTTASPGHTNRMQDEHYLFRTAFQILFQYSNNVLHKAREIQQMANLLLSNANATRVSTTLKNSPMLLPYIAVHIRTGAAFAGDPDRHTADDYTAFYHCAKRLQQEVLERQEQRLCRDDVQGIMPIYVASDDVRAKESLLAMDQEQSATNAHLSIRSLPNLTLYHMDYYQNTADANRNDGERTVWAELQVLMEATCIVSSTSGFSHLATWLQRLDKTKRSSSHRCAIHFEDCDNERLVAQAVDALGDEC